MGFLKEYIDDENIELPNLGLTNSTTILNEINLSPVETEDVLKSLTVHKAVLHDGNLTPYVISFHRNRTDEHSLRNEDNLWIMNAANVVSPFGMVSGGVLDRCHWMYPFCTSWTLTYFTVKKSLVLVALSYGALTQFGFSIAYGPPVQKASKWIPKRPALAVGFIVCGVGGGALVFNQLITAYFNPNNLTPDVKTSDGQKYFTDKEVLDRVPTLFLILAAVYAVCQSIGISALTKPLQEPAVTE
ncbi:uncharacterized protein LOC123555816 [Mercenaria mercenaria]|uniref:uncharacterized protein LOC123555816 n=1 Tax=Mercenaria mercenaria TaxID=6596 RepID=UPI00234F33BF|nr:uncharacterized protein LOC123555816 [Mercenaria mercenaria]